MFILTIYELDDYGLNILLQQAAADEARLKGSAVEWMKQRSPEHFDEGMFHDAPSDSIEDNFQAILLWSEYATSSGNLHLIIRPADNDNV